MGRLIDADFLISYIEEELALKYTGHLSNDVVCGMISRQNEIIQFIKAQPTALDVEAVVEELEAQKMLAKINFTDFNERFDIGMYQAFKEAIEIIMKGGVK